jgi:hypothetical protein
VGLFHKEKGETMNILLTTDTPNVLEIKPHSQCQYLATTERIWAALDLMRNQTDKLEVRSGDVFIERQPNDTNVGFIPERRIYRISQMVGRPPGRV